MKKLTVFVANGANRANGQNKNKNEKEMVGTLVRLITSEQVFVKPVTSTLKNENGEISFTAGLTLNGTNIAQTASNLISSYLKENYAKSYVSSDVTFDKGKLLIKAKFRSFSSVSKNQYDIPSYDDTVVNESEVLNSEILENCDELDNAIATIKGYAMNSSCITMANFENALRKYCENAGWGKFSAYLYREIKESK